MTRTFQKPIIKITRLLPPGICAITLDHTILVKPKCLIPRVIAHELVHVEQVERRGGFLKFIPHYLSDLVRHGYKNHPSEKEANGRWTVFYEYAVTLLEEVESGGNK